MLTMIFSFFSGTIGKYVGYGLIVMTIIGALITGVTVWDSKIKTEATLEFNNAQLQKTIDDQKEFINQLNIINADKEVQIDKLKQKNSILDAKTKTIDDYLNSAQDQGSSEILKKTIEELGK